jgi:hypothetical protein
MLFMKKAILATLLFTLSRTTLAFDVTGSCQGSTSKGISVLINNFVLVSDPSDYYAHVKIGKSEVATYALKETSTGFSGEATDGPRGSKSFGKDLGDANLILSADKKRITGTIGEEKLNSLTCTYTAQK